jgi:hypothetical protein
VLHRKIKTTKELHNSNAQYVENCIQELTPKLNRVSVQHFFKNNTISMSNELYQTYVKDCDCGSDGIIIYEGEAVCRWCRTPYVKAGSMFYEKYHFKCDHEPKDYEIVKFKQWTNEHGHVCANTDIHSVRRLSDGEVFTVGDKINFGTDGYNGYNPIEKFTIENHPIKYNCQALLVWNKNNYMFEISLWKKHKPVLFNTEDGQPIYEGQGYAYTPKGTLNYVNITDGNFHPLPKDGFLYFSTEAAAKEYVLMNKPCLSVNDIISICADDQDTLSTRRMHLLNTAKLKQQP